MDGFDCLEKAESLLATECYVNLGTYYTLANFQSFFGKQNGANSLLKMHFCNSLTVFD